MGVGKSIGFLFQVVANYSILLQGHNEAWKVVVCHQSAVFISVFAICIQRQSSRKEAFVANMRRNINIISMHVYDVQRCLKMSVLWVFMCKMA